MATPTHSSARTRKGQRASRGTSAPPNANASRARPDAKQTPNANASRARPDAKQTPNGSRARPDAKRTANAPRSAKHRGRGSRPLLPWIAIGAVVAIVAALVVVKLVTGTPGARSGQPGAGSVPASVLREATQIPAATFDSAGVAQGIAPPKALSAGTEALTSDGLPRIVYIGSEYCPYCAAQRWAAVVAMSRFGTFSGLGATESSVTDVFPGTKTFSFHGSTYQSPYLAFTGVELQTNRPAPGGGYTALDRPSAQDQALVQRFDQAPYANSPGAIPFLDIGNRYVVIGTSFDPGVLHGLTMAQIARDLRDPSSAVGRSVLGAANLLTAAMCRVTNGRPGSVCSSTGVTAAASQLGKNG